MKKFFVKYFLSEEFLAKEVFVFFIFYCLFPTIRVLTIGHNASKNTLELVLSSLPELWMAVLFLRGAVLWKRNIPKLHLIDYLLIVYVVMNITIGALLADRFIPALYSIRLAFFPIGFYILGRVLFLHNEEILVRFLNRFLILLLTIALAGIVLYFFFFDTMIEMILQSVGIVSEYVIVRMSSVFWTPVLLSPFMCIGFIYCIYKLCKIDRPIYYLFIAVFWSCLILSVGRGSIIATLFGMFFIIVYARKWKVLVKTIITMTVCCAILSFFIPFFWDLLKWIFLSMEQTASLDAHETRVIYAKKAVDVFVNHISGIGFGKTGTVARRFYSLDPNLASLYSTDSWYIKIANETGIAGLASYLLLVTAVVWLFIRNKIKSNHIAFFLVAFFCAFNIENIVHNLPDFVILSHFYWLMLGAAIHFLKIKKPVVSDH